MGTAISLLRLRESEDAFQRESGLPLTKQVALVSEAQRLRSLEDENSRLKRLVADLSLDKEMLKAVIAKNGLSA